MDKEKWVEIRETLRGVPFKTCYYRISDFGNVEKVSLSNKKKERLVPFMHNGHLCVNINYDRVEIRRLVARCFIKEFLPKCSIDYIDEDPNNCRADNLVCYRRKFGVVAKNKATRKNKNDQYPILRCNSPSYLHVYNVMSPENYRYEVLKSKNVIQLYIFDFNTTNIVTNKIWRPGMRAWSVEVPSIEKKLGVSTEDCIREYMQKILYIPRDSYHIFSRKELFQDAHHNVSKTGFYYIALSPKLNVYDAVSNAGYQNPIGSVECSPSEKVKRATYCLKTAFMISDFYNFVEEIDPRSEVEFEEFRVIELGDN